MHSPSLSRITILLIGLVVFASAARTVFAQSVAESLRPNSFLLTPTVTPQADSAPSADPSPAGTTPQGRLKGLATKSGSRDRNAPRRQDLTAFKIGSKHLSALFNGWEQGAGIGFGIELTTADSIPGIEFRFRALTSTRLYRRLEVSAYVPKIGDDKTHFEIWASYQRRTRDSFFGMGPRSNLDDRTNFDIESRDIEGVLSRDFTKQLQLGIYLGRQSVDNYRGKKDTEPAIDVLFSGNPNVQPITRWVPGLTKHVKFFNYGGYLAYDARNNESGLTRGAYLYGRIGGVDDIDNNVAPGYGWVEGQIDGRVYIPLGGDKTSFAFRTMADLKSPKGGSEIPFYAQSSLGGRSYVRGWNSYRFRAHNLLLFSGELRQTVYTIKEDRGADVIVFSDVGRSWGDARSKTNVIILRNDKFGEAPWRASFGGGFQFRVNKSVAVRIDIAHSPERNLVYFSVSRGF